MSQAIETSTSSVNGNISDNKPTKYNRNSCRGPSWITFEDEQLCRSWASTSAFSPRDSTMTSIWDQVKVDFDEKLKYDSTVRSKEGIVSRWQHICSRVLEFCDAYDEAKKSDQDNTNEWQIYLKAGLIYASNKQNKERFKLMHCWDILRVEDKWKALVEEKRMKNAIKAKIKKQKLEDEENTAAATATATNTLSPSDETTTMQDYPSPESELVEGREESPSTENKKKRRLEDDAQESRLEQENLELARLKIESKIMSIDATKFPSEIQRKYFIMRQKEIFSRYKNVVELD